MIKIFIFIFMTMLVVETQAQSSQKIDVFTSETEGYSCFRIPSIIISKSGTLLAFAEGRKNGSDDTGDIDLVMKKSTNNGKTWSNLQVVWDDEENVCGNPVPVVDKESGKIILVACWNNGKTLEKGINAGKATGSRRVFVLSSNDEGSTWTKPTEITSSVKKENWTWYATGPCHGIQLIGEKHRGRIIIPSNHRTTIPGDSNHSHCIYSDDKGETWHLGGIAEGDGNESTAAELKNGNIMLNMRNYNRKVSKCRIATISKDGGDHFKHTYYDRELIEPRCQGSLLNYSPEGKLSKTLLFSNPANETKRVNMTINISRNNGKSWSRKVVVYPGRSAYSDMVVLPSGNVGILYENGTNDIYERISFETFSSELFK